MKQFFLLRRPQFRLSVPWRRKPFSFLFKKAHNLCFKETALKHIFHFRAGLSENPYRIHLIWLVAGPALMLSFHAFAPGRVLSPASNQETEEMPGLPMLLHMDFLREFDPADQPAATTVTQELAARMAEAMSYAQLLQNYPEAHIAGRFEAMKYQQLALAALAVSLSSPAADEKRKWSEMAVDFSEIGLAKLKNTSLSASSTASDELNFCRLVAMGWNYYQGGKVEVKNLIRQYDVINENFLIRCGYCNLKILRKMDEDGLIRLPEVTVYKII